MYKSFNVSRRVVPWRHNSTRHILLIVKKLRWEKDNVETLSACAKVLVKNYVTDYIPLRVGRCWVVEKRICCNRVLFTEYNMGGRPEFSQTTASFHIL
jgi:hypothetical protein